MIKIKNVFLWTKERFEEPVITGLAAFSVQGPEQLWGPSGLSTDGAEGAGGAALRQGFIYKHVPGTLWPDACTLPIPAFDDLLIFFYQVGFIGLYFTCSSIYSF